MPYYSLTGNVYYSPGCERPGIVLGQRVALFVLDPGGGDGNHVLPAGSQHGRRLRYPRKNQLLGAAPVPEPEFSTEAAFRAADFEAEPEEERGSEG